MAGRPRAVTLGVRAPTQAVSGGLLGAFSGECEHCSATTSAGSQPSHSPSGPTPETPGRPLRWLGLSPAADRDRGDTREPSARPPGRGAGGGRAAALDRVKNRWAERSRGSGSEGAGAGARTVPVPPGCQRFAPEVTLNTALCLRIVKYFMH